MLGTHPRCIGMNLGNQFGWFQLFKSTRQVFAPVHARRVATLGGHVVSVVLQSFEATRKIAFVEFV